MVEAYQAYGTYDSIGQLVKELVQKTAMDVYGSHKVTLLDGTRIRLRRRMEDHQHVRLPCPDRWARRLCRTAARTPRHLR